jgi:transcription termination factor Rho
MTGNGEGKQDRSRGRSRRRRRRPGGAQGGRRGSGGAARRSRRKGRTRSGHPGQGPARGATVYAPPEGTPSLDVRGVLQIVEPRHGYLRSPQCDYRSEPGDAVVPRNLIADLGLETGVELEARAVPNGNGPPCVAEIGSINGQAHAAWSGRIPFKDLVAEDPCERIRLELAPEEVETRVVDLITPIGKGQRCLIVAPPKAGKTVLLQKIANSVTSNHPEIHLIVLLVDERPEEVTDMRRNVRGEVVASSSDEMARNHVQVAEIVLERSRRLVEAGRDVIVLLDSITRLSRAYNTQQRGSGRVLSGGIDARTMERPRRFFGAARNAVDGGSLTVIGTALVDTGSRMDEVIFQEFKGTGNTEIVMDRTLFERRIFPCIDISASGTRKEEKLFTPDEYQKVTLLRRALASLKPAEAMQLLTERLAKYATNAEFLRDLTK